MSTETHQFINDYFTFRCQKGMRWKGLAGKKVYEDRLVFESQVILSMGYAGYFLIVMDLLEWTRRQDILHGPGRGSGGGSLVAYILGITWLDPIKYNLYFERFLNPHRVSLPDFDLDFPDDKRHLVVEYIQQKYGIDHVAHIGTFGTMKAKAAIRDVCRTLGYTYDVGDHLASFVLPPVEGKPQTLATCFDKVPEFRHLRDTKGSIEADILRWAERLENKPRSFGTHASGIVIANSPVSFYLPLARGKEENLTTQFEMNTVEEVGLVKFDFLGLKTLTTMKRCLDLIKKNTGQDINLNTIPLEEPEVYRLFHTGELDGVFQFEGSGGIRDLAVQARPTTLEDLAVLNSIYRPGPIQNGMVSQYLQVRSGACEPEYFMPELQPILRETAGVMIYQEQILEICKQLAGYSMAEADIMRRVIGKKKPKEMVKQHEKFVTGMVTNGHSHNEGEQLFSDIDKFSGYGFNKSHAILYSFISYQCAYLKAFYPVEFMCACLTTDSDEYDKVVRYVEACRSQKIQILPPDINESIYEFSITKDRKSIKFGLGAIKNVGVNPVKSIQKERKIKLFTDLVDFVGREELQKINSRQLESLILAGAFDSIAQKVNRAGLINLMRKVWDFRDELKRHTSKMETYQKKLSAWQEREKEIAGGSKKKSLKKPETPEPPILPSPENQVDFTLFERLTKEKELLGYYISGHPLDHVPELSNRGLQTIRNIKKLTNQTRINLIAITALVKNLTTKKDKKKMAFLTLEDKTGTIETSVNPKTYEEYGHLIESTVPMGYKALAKVVVGGMSANEGEESVVRLQILEICVLNSQKQYIQAREKTEIATKTTNAVKLEKVLQMILQGKAEEFRKSLENRDTLLITSGHKWRLSK